MRPTTPKSISSAFLVAVLCVSAATAADKPAAAKKPVAVPSTTVRGIDPLSLPADQVRITSLSPLTVPIGVSPAGSAGGRSTLVFRVQIVTAQGFGEARKAAQVAEEIFDQPVHIDYEIPNFKVRVGDFADRAAADNYRRTALQLGYANCWVVPVTIGIAEASPLYDSLIAPVDSVIKSDSVGTHDGGE